MTNTKSFTQYFHMLFHTIRHTFKKFPHILAYRIGMWELVYLGIPESLPKSLKLSSHHLLVVG
jgi:hypothetical protein